MEKSNMAKGRKGQKGRIAKYDNTLKRMIAKQYLDGDQSLGQVAKEYGLRRQQVSRWVHQFSSELSQEIGVAMMTQEEQNDLARLQKQVDELNKKLEYERMRNFALETMADLAKTELGIDIRKNFGAKQPKE